MGRDFRPLGGNDAIEIGDLPACLGDLPSNLIQQFRRVGAAVSFVGVGKLLADIGEPGGTGQGVRHRVQEYVGIAVAYRMGVVRDFDTTQPQRTARGEPVGVFAKSDA